MAVRRLLNGGTWVWVQYVIPFTCFASVANSIDIGNKHVWKGRGTLFGDLGRRGVSFLLSASDCGWSTVHVEFTITDLVVPRPSNGVVTWCNTFRYGVLEGSSATTVRVCRQITGSTGGAATLDGMDDHPFGVFRRRLVCCQAHLA